MSAPLHRDEGEAPAPADELARLRAENEALVKQLRTYERTVRRLEMQLKVTDELAERTKAVIQDAYTSLEGEVEERRGVEARLREAMVRAEQASVAKSQFLANISHEIRTPVNGVIGMSELLLPTALDAEQQQYAETIRECARTLLALVDDVLDFSRIEAGRLELETIEFEPSSLARSLELMFEAAAQRKGLALSVAVAPEVPTRLVGDPLRIRQVLINLVANAIKFTSAGRVDVSLGFGEGCLVAVVQDTGPGIPAARQRDVFAPFTQLDASITRRHGGTGLGLAITHELCGLMGGSIELESPPGAGCTFRARIPCPTPAPAVEPPSGDAEPLAGRVLVVDDNAVNRKIAVTVLRRLGHDVREADGGEAAVAQAGAERFDLIPMDCQMPRMDGFTAARQIRADEVGGRTPIVAMTALAMNGDRERCLEAGMDDYLAKPVTVERLRATLRRWLPGRNAS